jgi:hypothetical protein
VGKIAQSVLKIWGKCPGMQNPCRIEEDSHICCSDNGLRTFLIGLARAVHFYPAVRWWTADAAAVR